MPRPETIVPKFGDWDGNEDLSYSIVFDKARADKERFIPAPKQHPKDPALEQQRLKAEKGASNAFAKRTMDTGSRGSRDSTPKLSSRHNYEGAVEFNPLQATQSDTSEQGFMDSSSVVSSSQQPTPMVSMKNSTGQEVMGHTDDSNDVLRGRMHRVPGPTRQTYQEYPVMSKFARSQGGSETSSIADLPEKRNLPKFGDWDVNDANAGEGFTVIFDRARDEKKSKGSQKVPPRYISPVRPAGDLYNESQPHKKKSGWHSIFCCSASTSG